MTALERKQHNEQLLSTWGIRLFDEIPPIEEENVIVLKAPAEIAKRILILTYLNCIASEKSIREQVINFLKQEGLWEETSEEEKTLFTKEELTEEEVLLIGWRSEAIWLLLWAIHKIDQLGLPVFEVNPQGLFQLLPPFFTDTQDFITTARSRPVEEIMDQADLIFRINWAIQKSPPQSQGELDLNASVAYERFNAIDWIIGRRESWDE